MDQIESFYTEATKMMDETKVHKVGRADMWRETSKAAAGLPDL